MAFPYFLLRLTSVLDQNPITSQISPNRDAVYSQIPQDTVLESAKCTLFKVARHPETIKTLITILPNIFSVVPLRKRTIDTPIKGIRARSRVFSPSDIQSLENRTCIAKQIIKKGDIQLTAEYRNTLRKNKRKQIINIIDKHL